ncbi:HCP-like protein [Epithele typhae]|uniref:HCP-like protein n=1 Tax=Epithele typhae TaxID=378194 RepID=UPI002008C058|nr:HCP-like protein [Epithele typhae]KAH9942227.1 HCP-like protein [Epithele typhae]
MPSADRKMRKASLAAFCMVAFAALSNANDASTQRTEVSGGIESASEGIDSAAEASRAYRQAMSTLATLTALPSAPSDEPSIHTTSSPLAALLPNIQGQGPIASALRILVKLGRHSWVPSFVTEYISTESTGSRRKEEDHRGRAVKVIDLLHHAADLGNRDALYTLGQVSLFPPNTYFPTDPTTAFDSFQAHADMTGNASSQALVGFFHSTGYHGVVPVDGPKGQLYLTFAGHGGHKGAQMALGYRHWSGIGVSENCLAALNWYEDAAEQAMAKFLSGPPGGRTLPLVPPRLSDLVGGVYGPGASVASTGLQAGRAVIKTANARAAGETWDDLIEYYLFNADRGEIDFAYRLGKIFYQGSVYPSPGGIASGGDGASAIPRDFHRARYYFNRIARIVWPRDPSDPRRDRAAPKEEGTLQASYAALAAGYLGRMYLRGEGVKQDYAMAKMWFERGAEHGEKESHNGLGIIWRDGLMDGKKDLKKAMSHFHAAANQDLAEAHVNLAKYHFHRGELKQATAHFENSLRLGSPFEAYYYLAGIQAMQARERTIPHEIAGSSCAVAVSFFKLVAERGSWDDDMLREADYYWSLGTERGGEMAMLRWWIAAERGLETAQNNLAYVLDQDKSILRFTRFAPHSPSNDTARLALTQWIRSAAQRNVDALVKVGDYYYHGLGVPDEPEGARWEKAAGYYQSAADTQMSALAMWNLGWMYENGVGVPQDFHLAKRHYDLAYETNAEAYLPVLLSLLKLHARSAWHTLMGGQGGLTLWDGDEETTRSYYDNPEIDAGQDGEHADPRGATQQPALDEIDDADDGPWYMGKARDEFNRRRRGGSVDGDGEEDPVEWARERRREEAAREGEDYGPEDYFDGATRGGVRREARYREEEGEVDDLGETVLIVVLCLLVSGLLYVRGRWMERIRRDEEERRRAVGGAPRNDGALGVFPPPGDPARDDWAVLR